jgi:hypothetical protein
MTQDSPRLPATAPSPGVLLAVATLVADSDDLYEGTPRRLGAVLRRLGRHLRRLLAIGVWINRSARRLYTRR